MDILNDKFNSFLSNQNSISTKARYKYELANFIGFLKHPEFASVAMADILRYKDSLKNHKPITIAWKLKVLKSFFEFLKNTGEITANPLRDIKIPKYSAAPVVSLTQNEAKSLIKTPNRKTLIGKRDFAIISLFLATGIRISELVKLTVNDILKTNGFYAIKVNGKGNKDRILKIPVKVYQAINSYRANLNTDNPYIFPSNRSHNAPKHISQRSVAFRIKKYSAKVQFSKRIYPHLLRHTCFTLELTNHANIKQIQLQAGHESINTTSGYLHALEISAVDSNPLF